MKNEDFKNVKSVYSNITRELPNVEKIVLFGSAVKNEHYDDIDLLVVYKDILDIPKLTMICENIKKERGYNFSIQHLFDYSSCSLHHMDNLHILYANKNELCINHPIIDNVKKGYVLS